ncbi:MAG: cytochrome d ubiquinol oxidase subunit II [Desulfobacteraceae bacterium]|nr:cytochrome d ubiquinol oxidase subunit II [Desulfobacteraceae bacterium]
MFSFENILNLPLIWYGLIAVAIFLYVLLDGFDLGVGILFPFAPSDQCRDRLMNSIAPFWDGNETWLVLGGGGLFAAFPLAYSVIMPALYIPIILMLLGLIFRGVAFEFRFKADKSKKIWDYAFHFGSLGATFMQGMVLGTFVQGIPVTGRSFSGGPYDWLNAYSVMTGIAMIFGYALLGATWVVMKTEGTTQEWARKSAGYVLGYVGLFLVMVSISMPVMNPEIRKLWFSLPNVFLLFPIPCVTLIFFIMIWKDLYKGFETRPFVLSLGVFTTAYLGLGISLWPWLIPFEITYQQAAAVPESLSLLLVGTGIMLPVVLGYVAYSYYLFRGKVTHEGYY